MKITIEKDQLEKIVEDWAREQPFDGVPNVKFINKRSGAEFEITYSQPKANIEEDLEPEEEAIEDVEESTSEDVSHQDEESTY